MGSEMCIRDSNKTDVAKTFSAGEILVGPDKIAFSLDEEVKVASKSSQQTEEGEEIIYGKAEASATAVSIGTEANLDSGSQLTFKEYPSSLYDAVAKDGFSGGTSRQVRAVSEEDKNKLLQELTEELKNKAKEKIKSEDSSIQEVLDKPVKTEVLQEDFDADVGDEKDELSLTLKKRFVFLSYQNNSLQGLVSKYIGDKTPSGYLLKDGGLEVNIDQIEFKDSKAEIKIKIKVSLLPEQDLEEIKSNLKGRYPEVVRDYLASLPGFSKADIKISPQLPAKLRTLPRIKDNIVIKIEVEE